MKCNDLMPILKHTAILVIVILISGTKAESRPGPLQIAVDFPVIQLSDDLSDITAGAAWDFSFSPLLTRFRERELRNGILLSDSYFFLKSDGLWLLDAALNSKPLTANIHFDLGLELAPRPVDDIPPDLFIGDIPFTDIGFWNWLYHYRLAMILEAGVESDQTFDNSYFTAGPGLRILNLSRSGWSGWLPTLLVMYEGVIRLSDDESSQSSVDDAKKEFSRIRIVHRHQLDLGVIRLPDFTLAGGYQYTYDVCPSRTCTNQEIHSRFGWVVDFSRAIRWTRKDEPGRLDLFVRYKDGRIAPLVISDRSFTLGFRIPYSR